MEEENLKQSIAEYETQLEQITLTLSTTDNEEDRENLLSLQIDINQLINLTKENLNAVNVVNEDSISNEYSLFMAEMAKEGAIENKATENDIKEDLNSLEGMKCKAPHKHQWGDTVYHNAIISSILSIDSNSYDDIKVKIIFINPTHEEMLPCPFLLNESCKFSDDQCRYSHGEVVELSLLQEYAEPQFELLKIGCQVLAKHSNNLWQRAVVKKVLKVTCFVKFVTNNKESEVNIHDTYPLDNEATSDEESEEEPENDVDLINSSLMNPTNQDFGNWQQYTKGYGSKIMQKMGYIVGTGLGKNNDGRLDPVSAVILPAGKSLDFCMELRENAGGDKDLFSVEKKLKRLQKRQERRNIKAYEREKNKTDVFNFLNRTISRSNKSTMENLAKQKHKQEIKKETSRNLNVASLQTEENIKKCEIDIFKIKESLTRHTDKNSQMNKSLKTKLFNKQEELKLLKHKATNIKNEQSLRNDEKKLTIF